MKTTIGEKGLEKSWQQAFPKVTECCRCKAEARIAFVAHEGLEEDDRKKEQEYVSHLHVNHAFGKLWLHDACAVAVYLCGECLKPTAICNQG